MRGTRVDTLDNGRFDIHYFGHFGACIPSNTFEGMSEKDAYNLYNQLGIALFPSDKEGEDD